MFCPHSNNSYGHKCISLAKGLGNFLQEFLQHRCEPLTFPTVTGYHLAFYTSLFNDKLKIISEKNYIFKNFFILYLPNFIYSSLNIFVMISVISFHDFSLFRVPLFKWFNSCFHSYQFPLSFPVNRRMLTCIKPDLLWTLLILQVSQIPCHKEDNFLLFFLKVKISWRT